jgi:hypothetical protein
VIEITRFRLREGTDESMFIEADARLQREFAYRQPGLLRRTTAHGEDGGWIVIHLWRSREDSDRCSARWDSDSIVSRFMDLVDRASFEVARYEELSG